MTLHRALSGVLGLGQLVTIMTMIFRGALPPPFQILRLGGLQPCSPRGSYAGEGEEAT